MPKGGNGGGGNGGGLPKITGRNNTDDLLIGTGVAELIKGLNGNDTLIGNGGDDILDGGGDYDIASYSGSVFDYAIDIAAGTVTDLNVSDGDDGQDTLINVEQSDFADATVYFDGTNNDPLVSGSISSGIIGELADGDAEENTRLHTTTGSVDFIEFDRTTGHALSFAPAGAGYLGIFTVSFSDADTSDGSGQLIWSFDVADADIDHLAAGEILSQTYSLTIDDGQGGSLTENMTISIVGENDGAVDIALSANLVGENLRDVAIGALSATDPDSNDPITFSIVPGGDSDLFSIVGDELRLGSTPLDYEYMDTRSVTVRATDSGGASFDKTFDINVVDSVIEYLTTGTDSNAATAYDTTFVGDITTLNASDSLVASDITHDLLRLESTGFYDLSALSQFSGFDQIIVDDLASDNGDAGLVLSDFAGVMSLEYYIFGASQTWLSGVPGGNYITMSGGMGNDTVQVDNSALLAAFWGNEGDDAVYVDSQEPILIFDGGDGDDLLQIGSQSAWASNLGQEVWVEGQAGYDTLSFAGSGLYALDPLVLTGIEHLKLDANDINIFYLSNDHLSGMQQITSDYTNTFLTTYESVLDLSGLTVSGAMIDSESDGTRFLVDSKATAFQISGGDGSFMYGTNEDIIDASGFAFTSGERDTIFGSTSIDVVSDDLGTFGNEFRNLLMADANGGLMVGWLGDDRLVGDVGNDTFVFAPGDGFDNVANFEAGAGSNDVIDLQAYDPIAAQAAIDAAIEIDGSTLIIVQNDDAILLEGVPLASLHADDFIV